MADMLEETTEVSAAPELDTGISETLETGLNTTPNTTPMYTSYTAPETVEPETPGFFDVIGRASEQTNLLTRGLIASYEASKDWKPDPTYNYWDHRDELVQDIPPEYWGELATASSKAEAENIRWRIKDELEGKEMVAQAGYSGIAAQLVTGVLSPENILPMGAAYNWADKGSRLAATLKTGAITGATAGAAEAALVAGTYTKDAEDILYASTFGFALGGAFGAALHQGTPSSIVDDVAEEVTETAVEGADTVAPVARTQTPQTPLAFGPPKPKIITETTERAIERRTGPIDVDAHVAVNALYDRLQNIDVNTASRKVQQSIADDFAKIDHRASLDSDTEAKLEEIYTIVGYTPTETITETFEVGGSFRQLEEDMAYAARELRAEMDTRLPDDFDDAGAARNREVEHQIVETSEREDDIIDAATDWVNDNRIKEQLDDSKTNKAAVMSRILSSDYTRLINHESPVVKRLAYDLLEGGTGTLKQGKTAAMYKDVYERQILSKGLIPLNENYVTWARDHNLNFMQRNFHTSGYDRFYTEVRNVLEHRAIGKAAPESHPSVLAAADAWDDMMQHALVTGQKAGVESLQGIPVKAGYVPLHWNGQKIMKLGKSRSRALITQAYKSVGIDEDMAQKIADAVVKRALDKRAGVDADVSGLLQKNQRAQLAEQLNRMGLSEKEISNFVKQLDAKEAQAGPGFTKGRTRIDMTTSLNGDRVLDLVDNDLNTVASAYARDLSGMSALAKKGITSEGKWRAVKSAALKDNARIKAMGKKGDDGLSEHLDDVRSYFSAFPVAGGINKNARRIQQTATISSLGMVGAAQLAELGTVVGRLGVKAAAKSMPSVRELFTLAKKVSTGKDPIIDELRPLLGDFDYDHLLYRPDIILDDKITAAVDSTPFGTMLDKGLGKANTALGYASGMNSVRHFEHQLAAKMIINKFADLAVNPSKAKKSLARLEDIGVDSKDLGKIISSIKKYADFDDRGTLTKMHLDKWNEEVAETFSFAINKHVAQVVQRQLAGETSNWMHKTIGSLLTQFRHFPIVAYEKQLLRNLRHHDQAFYTTMLYGFAVSYAIQAVRAGLSGDDMNSEDTVKRAVNYMGMATVAPDALTIAAQLNLVPEALNFRKVGHTGSRADQFDLIDYIPAAGQINKMAKLASLPGKAAMGDVTESDVRAGWMALPFATTLMNKAVMQAVLED